MSKKIQLVAKEFKFCESVVEMLSGRFFKNFENTDGEFVEAKKDKMIALMMVGFVASDNDNKRANDLNSKAISDDTWRDYKDLYKPLLRVILDLGILLNSGRVYWLNPDYKGSTRVYIDKKIISNIFGKSVKRAKKCTTQKEIRVSATNDQIVDVLRDQGYDDKDIDTQLDIVYEINHNRLNLHKKRRSRLYSNLTLISKHLHQFLTIDGQHVIEIDQHATFVTLLPAIFRHLTLNKKNLEAEREIKELYAFVLGCDDVYIAIRDDIGGSLTRDDIKITILSFICDPKVYSYKGVKGDIQKWFKIRYSALSDVLDAYRRNNKITSMLTEIESRIFCRASRILNDLGLDCYTKHDALLVLPASESSARDILGSLMLKEYVPSILKTKTFKNLPTVDSYAEIIDDKLVFVPIDQNSGVLYTSGQGEERRGIRPNFESSVQTPVQTPVQKISVLSDGRYRVSIKNRKYNSKNGETKDMFITRLKTVGLVSVGD